MEMMIVLLIVAIIAAASAPMVTKKLSRNTGTGDSPWVFTGLENSIAFNINNSNSSAIIGATTVEGMPVGMDQPRLFLNGDATHPALAFGENGKYVSHIVVDKTRNIITFTDAVVGTNSTAIGLSQNKNANGLISRGATLVGSHAMAHNYATALGYQSGATGQGSLALGHATIASGAESIAIGTYSEEANQDYLTQASGQNSIAIGTHATSSSGNYNIAVGANASAVEGAIAIGTGADATANWATTIGTDSQASQPGAIALGAGALATGEQSIAIGNEDCNQQTSTNTTTTSANAQNAIAIGTVARADHSNSVAIGYDAKTRASDQIVLGNEYATVYIPGNLVVGRAVYITGACSPGNGDTNLPLYIRDEHNGSSGITTNQVFTREHVMYTRNETNKTPPTLSDRRLKNVGEKYTAGLEELKKLDFFHFTFKQDEEKTPHVGVIAQDLQKVFPDAVIKGDDGYLRIRWEDMFYAVINAVKELDNKIAEIVQNITDMNSRIETQNSINEEQNKTIEEQQKTIELLKNNNEEQQRLIKDLENRIEKLEKLSVKRDSSGS